MSAVLCLLVGLLLGYWTGQTREWTLVIAYLDKRRQAGEVDGDVQTGVVLEDHRKRARS